MTEAQYELGVGYPPGQGEREDNGTQHYRYYGRADAPGWTSSDDEPVDDQANRTPATTEDATSSHVGFPNTPLQNSGHAASSRGQASSSTSVAPPDGYDPWAERFDPWAVSSDYGDTTRRQWTREASQNWLVFKSRSDYWHIQVLRALAARSDGRRGKPFPTIEADPWGTYEQAENFFWRHTLPQNVPGAPRTLEWFTLGYVRDTSGDHTEFSIQEAEGWPFNFEESSPEQSEASAEPLPPEIEEARQRDDPWTSGSEEVAAASHATAPAPPPPSDSTSSDFFPYGMIDLVQPDDPLYATDGVPWQSCTRCKVYQPFARCSDETCLNVLGIECIFESRHERAASSSSEPKKPNQGMDWSQGEFKSAADKKRKK